MKKHILVISQYFYPENFRINDICSKWVEKGYKVTVITGIPNYPKGKYFKGYGLFRKRKEVYNGVNIKRLFIFSRGKSRIKLILNYLSFVISGFFWKLFSRLKPDLVFIFEVSPMTQALPGIWFAKRRKIPSYIYVQDLWPENLEIVGGITNPKIIKKVDKMVDYIYKNSEKILVTSNSFKENIENRGVDSKKVVYWPQYAEDYYQPQLKEKENNKLNIMFTGNIGQAQGLEILPLVAKRLKTEYSNLNIKFTLVGDGRNRVNLQQTITDCDVSNYFEFLGQKDPEEIPLLLLSADVAFLSFSNNELFRMTIPAKLQTYMACAKPILAVALGETKDIVINSNSGLVSNPEDVDQLLKNILIFYNMDQSTLKSYASNAHDYVVKNFNKDLLLTKFDEIIGEYKNVW